ncbi:MAG: molybdenum cofactor biosynthesis protein MoaE [Cytophagales bacterium]|nr:molybdenum cofactor biosynthesis protein MoaE [Cytophagales bacterium]
MNQFQDIFINGPISSDMVANCISALQANHQAGACNIFLGKVRNDMVHDKEVQAIYYTAYQDMAIDCINDIVNQLLKQYNILSINIQHSLGVVHAGEICIMVMVAASHRQDAINTCETLVNRIKKEVPVWGKELYDNDQYTWKINK